jgi:putative aldouronate transport system permease protein
MKNKRSNLAYNAMMAPGTIMLIVFSLLPIVGLYMAFLDYKVTKPFFGLASKFVGLKNFRTLFAFPDAGQAIVNTLIISVWKMILFVVVPVIFTLLLNELTALRTKRVIQTVAYLPNFLSWVVVAAMFRTVFSFGAPVGMLNQALMALHIIEKPIEFMVSNTWFRSIIISTDVWKGFGYSAVVYIAAVTSIDVGLYEAADIDGANRWQKMFHITLPGILPVVILMSTLSLGNILNAGFDQVFNMYNTQVYQTGDIIDTYIYRTGLVQMKFGLGSAVGLAKSGISFVLIIISHWLADRFAGYKIF